MKYLLCSQETKYVAGETDLKKGIGQSLYTNGCTVLLCTEGRAIVTINFRKQVLKKGDVAILFSDIFFIPSQVSQSFAAVYVSLAEDALEEAYYKMSSIPFWEFIYDNPICRLNEQQYQLVYDWCRQMKWTIEECSPEYRLSILSGNFYNLLMAIDSEARRYDMALINRSKKNRAWTLLGNFCSLLSKHSHEIREVKFYADKMCITTDYLYKITNKTLQQKPKDVIDQQIITEIKTYLTSTDLSVKDIAAELSFEDPSYMCRFFRKRMGLSPIDFRNKSLE